jgi:hypothetical protein
MLVQGQPKTAAEYIQATSRIGRDHNRPGLVVAVLNLHKPRDRTHFEQFGTFHRSFYRAVEATSVTPWAARALDRALAAVVVAAARHIDPGLTLDSAVKELKNRPKTREAVRDAIVQRAPPNAVPGGPAALKSLVDGLLDDWIRTSDEQSAGGNVFGYAQRPTPHRLLHMPLDPGIENLSAAHSRPLDARCRADRYDPAARSLGSVDRECGRPRMSKNAQRLSQVISTFGPGAMVDLPTRSVVIGGLDLWEMRGGTFTTIPEPRVIAPIERLLKQLGRLPETKNLSLRTPPVTDGRPGQLPAGIRAPVFPAWFVCEHVEIVTAAGKPARRRRLVRWQDLATTGGRRRFTFDDGTKSDVTPIRFVGACENGHLQDRLAMGRSWRPELSGADADRGEGNERRSGRHDGRLRLRQRLVSPAALYSRPARHLPW